MSLPNSQLQILAEIEDRLQADPSLVSVFSAFNSVTHSARMPAVEQLSLTPQWPAGWRRSRRAGSPTFFRRLILPLVPIVAVLAIALTVTLAVAGPGTTRSGCVPRSAAAHTDYAETCAPVAREHGSGFSSPR